MNNKVLSRDHAGRSSSSSRARCISYTLAFFVVASVNLSAACRPPYVCSSDDDCDSASYCRQPSTGGEGLCQPQSKRPDDAGPGHDASPGVEAGPDDDAGRDDDAGPAAVTITHFTASAEVALYGTEVELSWATTHAQSCTLSSTSGSAESVPTSHSGHAVTVTRDETFTLSCAGADGSSDAASLDVELEVEVVSFTGPSAVNHDDEVTLQWEVRGSTSCEITDTVTSATLYAFGSDELPASSGTLADTAAADRTYRLSCAGPGGAKSAEVSVDVWRIATFESTPSAVSAAAPAVSLVWTTAHADPAACTVSGVNDGSPQPPPLATAVPADETFTLTCAGANGADLVATLDVPVLIDAFSPREEVVGFGGQATLEVVAAPEATCTVDGNEVLGPSYQTGALQTTRTFELSCTLDGKTASAVTTVKVRPAITSCTGTLDDLSGSVRVVLSWDVSANTTGCVVKDGDGAEVPGVRAPSGLTLEGGGSSGVVGYTLECTSDPAEQDPRLVVTSGPVNVFWGPVNEGNLGSVAGASLVTGNVNLVFASVSDLGAFSSLVEVGGGFALDADGVLGLDDLATLRRVLGDLTLTGNNSLGSADLPALTTVGGGLTISANAALMGLRLERLTTVGGPLTIEGNPIAELDLRRLETVLGPFSLKGTRLQSVELLDGTTVIPSLGALARVGTGDPAEELEVRSNFLLCDAVAHEVYCGLECAPPRNIGNNKTSGCPSPASCGDRPVCTAP